jgi:hypothetical protein
MDALAAAAAKSAGWPASQLTAVYHEAESAGVERLKAKTPSLALVPLPFFLAHAEALRLTPRAQAVQKDGHASVAWTLVAKKGSVTGAASLSGFTIVSLSAYAPDFIRRVALAPWGKLPADVTFSSQEPILSALRKAATGEKVAVLLDEAQARSLPTLPFAADLETIATSPALPDILLCSVGTSASAATVTAAVSGLLKLGQSPEGSTALDAVRLAKFVPLDTKGVAAARAAYAPSAKTAAR